MIEGVVSFRPLVHVDARGSVMRMLRTDDPQYAGFGEIYFSTVNPGIVKGWKRHREMTMTLATPAGRILLVLYDDREGSPTVGTIQEFELGPHDYQVVTVPPMLWNGFMGLGEQPSIVANCASIRHRPDEADSCDTGNAIIPYRWPAPGSR